MTINYCKPTEDFLSSIDIHTLLPQQEPFVMVGSLVAFDEVKTATETIISSTNLFVKDGQFCTAGMIENIAQTCAARIGYYNKYILKKGIQIGVIAAIRNLKVYGHPVTGDTILTTTKVIGEIMGMTLAEATITSHGKTLVTSQIKLAVKDGE